LDHPDSFGALFFTGDVLQAIPALLQRCGFQVLDSVPTSGAWTEVYAAMAADETVLAKGAFLSGRWTVLLDPDLELYTEEHALAAFCAEFDCRALAALWEEDRQELVLSEFNAAGLRRQTMWIGGEAEADGQREPRPEVEANPNFAGLLAALAAAGAPNLDTAGQVQAVVWHVEE
jgi:hypothetical protein